MTGPRPKASTRTVAKKAPPATIFSLHSSRNTTPCATRVLSQLAEAARSELAFASLSCVERGPRCCCSPKQLTAPLPGTGCAGRTPFRTAASMRGCGTYPRARPPPLTAPSRYPSDFVRTHSDTPVAALDGKCLSRVLRRLGRRAHLLQGHVRGLRGAGPRPAGEHVRRRPGRARALPHLRPRHGAGVGGPVPMPRRGAPNNNGRRRVLRGAPAPLRVRGQRDRAPRRRRRDVRVRRARCRGGRAALLPPAAVCVVPRRGLLRRLGCRSGTTE